MRETDGLERVDDFLVINERSLLIILINRKFNDDYRYLILILKYTDTRYFDIF